MQVGFLCCDGGSFNWYTGEQPRAYFYAKSRSSRNLCIENLLGKLGINKLEYIIFLHSQKILFLMFIGVRKWQTPIHWRLYYVSTPGFVAIFKVSDSFMNPRKNLYVHTVSKLWPFVGSIKGQLVLIVLDNHILLLQNLVFKDF